MTVRVEVEPAVLEWAVERSGRGDDLWTKSFPRSRYDSWLDGTKRPTYKQLQEFADKTRTPFGFLLLDQPVAEEMPIADFRAGPEATPGEISADLREVIYQCQDRQDWYREHRLISSEEPLSFVGSARLGADPATVAGQIATVLDWTADVRRSAGSWAGAFAELRERVEAIGVLVVVSGIVGANTHRKLDTDEFRGFALVDSQASLVFVNGADYETAKIFTLAHELAHVWLDAPGLSDLEPSSVRTVDEERWCNRVAAELLVPAEEFASAFDPSADLQPQLEPLATHFRVSTEVILGRIRELGYIDWNRYLAERAAERARVKERLAEQEPSSGGNFYNTKPVQLSKRFMAELIASTLEGRTSYTDAYRLLGVKKRATFDNLAERLGVL